jgi:hypothetical protein
MVEGTSTVYHLSPLRRAILIAFWGLFAIPLLAVGIWMNDPAALATGILFSLITAPIFAVSGWWYPRLVLTSNRIERYNLGYRLTTTWDNVADIRLVKGSEGFILRQSMEDKGAYLFARAANLRFGIGLIRLYDPEVLSLIRERRFLPIEAFAYWLKHGELGHRIALQAPWLADQLPL